MTQQRILIIEDEVKLAEALVDFLTASGYATAYAVSTHQAEVIRETFNPELILLDWMLPDQNGADYLKQLRTQSSVPVIMLTARVEESDVLKGFEVGADDYVTKPFSMKQLLMRIRAVLKRVYGEPEKLTACSGWLVLVEDSRMVSAGGEIVSLTPSEYAILHSLMRHPNKVFTREELIFSALGDDYEGTDRAVDSYIKNLRHKLGSDVKVIETVHGIGYRLGGLK